MTGGTQEPWYRQLGVDPSEREQAQKEIEALNRRAAVLATTSPERSIALREQSRRLRQSMLEDAPSIEASPSPTSDTEKRDGGFCIACGSPHAPKSQFCIHCGIPISSATNLTCKQCRLALAPGHRFCQGCGTPAVHEVSSCPKCSKQPKMGDLFCTECGYQFA